MQLILPLVATLSPDCCESQDVHVMLYKPLTAPATVIQAAFWNMLCAPCFMHDQIFGTAVMKLSQLLYRWYVVVMTTMKQMPCAENIEVDIGRRIIHCIPSTVGNWCLR